MERNNIPNYDDALDLALSALWSAEYAGHPVTADEAAGLAVDALSEVEVREALTEQLASMLRFLAEEDAK